VTDLHFRSGNNASSGFHIPCAKVLSVPGFFDLPSPVPGRRMVYFLTEMARKTREYPRVMRIITVPRLMSDGHS